MDRYERTLRLIDRVSRRAPQAVRLAELASLAVRVDSHLLRQLRLELLPEADVGAEADLWFSPLVESRGPAGFVLDPIVAELLQRHLLEDEDRFRAARREIVRAHAAMPPAIQAEEEIHALALEKGVGAAAEIEERLQPLVRAIVQGGQAGTDLARWVLRAAPRFHPIVRETEAAQTLILTAPLLLGHRRILKEGPKRRVSVRTLGWALPSSARRESVRIGVELVEVGVQFLAAGETSDTVALPQTNPLLVELEWDDGKGTRRITVEPVAGTYAVLAGKPQNVLLTTLTGEQYRLASQPSATLNAPPMRSASAVSADPAMLAACVQLEPLGHDGNHLCVAFAVAPSLFLAPAVPLENYPIVAVAGTTRQVEVMHGAGAPLEEQAGALFLGARPIDFTADPIMRIADQFPSGEIQAAAVGFDDAGARWLEVVFPAVDEASDQSRYGIVPDAPALAVEELNKQFLGSPVVHENAVIGAIVEVLQGGTHVRVVGAAYLQGVRQRLLEELGRVSEPQPDTVASVPWERLQVTATRLEGSVLFRFLLGDSRFEVSIASSQVASVDRLSTELLSTGYWEPERAHALSELLLPAEAKDLMRSVRNVVLLLDEETARYPWEFLDAPAPETEPTGNTGAPLAIGRGLLRQLGMPVSARLAARVSDRSALVLGESPFSSKEGSAEVEAVAEGLARAGFAVETRVRASNADMLEALYRRPYRVLHLSGGRMRRGEASQIPAGIAITDLVLGTAEIEGMREVPEVVFCNFHSRDTMQSRQAGHDDDPLIGSRLAAELAAGFVAKGVRAFIAPVGASDDEATTTFALSFYNHMLSGVALGEALRRARAETFERHPKSKTWGVFQCYGDPSYCLVRDEAAEAVDSMPRRAVFLSYAREDRAVVESIRNDLDADGVDVWFDRGELRAADDWDQKIRAIIDACALFVPIISRAVLGQQARSFRREWEHALKVQQQRPRQPDGSPSPFIVPVVIDNTDMQTPGVKEYFQSYQAEHLPKGRTTPEFRAMLKHLFRNAQKASQGM